MITFGGPKSRVTFSTLHSALVTLSAWKDHRKKYYRFPQIEALNCLCTSGSKLQHLMGQYVYPRRAESSLYLRKGRSDIERLKDAQPAPAWELFKGVRGRCHRQANSQVY